jgi:hypothetical protein
VLQEKLPTELTLVVNRKLFGEWDTDALMSEYSGSRAKVRERSLSSGKGDVSKSSSVVKGKHTSASFSAKVLTKQSVVCFVRRIMCLSKVT